MKKFRITIEQLDVGKDGRDTQLAVYMTDRNQIAGDVWLNTATPRHSFDLESEDFIVAAGFQCGSIRAVCDLIEWERRK